MSEVTVKELDELTKKLVELNKSKDALEDQVTVINKEIMQIEQQCTNYMKELERDEYVSPFGKVSIEEKWRVNLPDTPVAKKLFFDHLRERGLFDKYATVNSNSLNAYFKAEWEEAKRTGNVNFALPGIEAPRLFEKTNFKPNKEVKKNGTTAKPNSDTPVRGIDPDEPIPF
jgi:chromosome segregation ATPase